MESTNFGCEAALSKVKNADTSELQVAEPGIHIILSCIHATVPTPNISGVVSVPRAMRRLSQIRNCRSRKVVCKMDSVSCKSSAF